MNASSYLDTKYITIIFSIIRTALINGFDIKKYLIYVLNNLGKLTIEELLPYMTKLTTEVKK
ncbi:MAG: transposase domain-containing protein [Erysipelotrichia bacterium]|jgi:hypothetical protein|nr:transposase domain-containing protein [Erysipelotrichia bacterium]